MPRRLWIPLLTVALLAAPARARVIERIVAVVNEDVILLSELEMRVRPLMPQLKIIMLQDMRMTLSFVNPLINYTWRFGSPTLRQRLSFSVKQRINHWNKHQGDQR